MDITNATTIQIYDGFVSIREDGFERYRLVSSTKRPKPHQSLVGFVHVFGTDPNPQNKWKQNILNWHDKDFDYRDGCFFRKPKLHILKVGEGVFGLDIPNQKMELYRAVYLFNGDGELLSEDSWSLDKIKESFIHVIKNNLARFQ